MYIYIYMYIYIDLKIYVYIYIHIYLLIYTLFNQGPGCRVVVLNSHVATTAAIHTIA